MTMCVGMGALLGLLAFWRWLGFVWLGVGVGVVLGVGKSVVRWRHDAVVYYNKTCLLFSNINCRVC